MQEMIKKILEMDVQACNMAEDAAALKIKDEMTINERKSVLKGEYIVRARKQIEELKETERVNAEAEWEKTKIKYEEALLKLNEQCNAKKDEWVKEIVRRVLNYT